MGLRFVSSYQQRIFVSLRPVNIWIVASSRPINNWISVSFHPVDNRSPLRFVPLKMYLRLSFRPINDGSSKKKTQGELDVAERYLTRATALSSGTTTKAPESGGERASHWIALMKFMAEKRPPSTRAADSAVRKDRFSPQWTTFFTA